jgi:hypothetical protein
VKSPKVGIFWLVKGRLVFDTTSLADAESYGYCKGHAQGHIDSWKQLQNAGMVSNGAEYEEFPRGRVVYNVKREKFTLLADRCILKKASLLKKIMNELELPVGKTECDTDPHYRCYKCLGFKI